MECYGLQLHRLEVDRWDGRDNPFMPQVLSVSLKHNFSKYLPFPTHNTQLYTQDLVWEPVPSMLPGCKVAFLNTQQHTIKTHAVSLKFNLIHADNTKICKLVLDLPTFLKEKPQGRVYKRLCIESVLGIVGLVMTLCFPESPSHLKILLPPSPSPPIKCPRNIHRRRRYFDEDLTSP